jgi:hypothetical protein
VHRITLQIGAFLESDTFQVYLVTTPHPAHHPRIGEACGGLGVVLPSFEGLEFSIDYHGTIQHRRWDLIKDVTAALVHNKKAHLPPRRGAIAFRTTRV